MKLKTICCIASIIILYVNSVNAQISAASFKVLDQYLQGGKILIKNATSSTEIKIEVSFTSYSDNQGYAKPASTKTRLATGTSTGQVIYLSSQETTSSTEFARYNMFLTKTFTINIDNSKLANGVITLLVQPAGSSEGSFTGKNYSYVLETPPVVVDPVPVKMPIYLVSHKDGGVNDIGQLLTTNNLPAGWHSYGIAFKSYTDQNSIGQFGTVPTYQYRYLVYDSNSQVADPKEIFFYSTSNNFTPIASAGYTYQLQSKTTLFYAFQTQVSNTVAILECRHKSAPIVIYKSSESEINLDMYDTSVAFYAYRYNQ